MTDMPPLPPPAGDNFPSVCFTVVFNDTRTHVNEEEARKLTQVHQSGENTGVWITDIYGSRTYIPVEWLQGVWETSATIRELQRQHTKIINDEDLGQWETA